MDLDGNAKGVPKGPVNDILPCGVEVIDEDGSLGPLGNGVVEVTTPAKKAMKKPPLPSKRIHSGRKTIT